MGKVVVIVMIVLFVLGVVGILALYIINDILGAKRYKNAERCRGTVLKELEHYACKGYGGGLFVSPRRFYNQYEVEFYVNDKQYIETIQTKEEAEVGETVEVRYTLNDDGEPWISTRMKADRLRDLCIGGAIGLVVGIFFVVLKIFGLID